MWMLVLLLCLGHERCMEILKIGIPRFQLLHYVRELGNVSPYIIEIRKAERTSPPREA